MNVIGFKEAKCKNCYKCVRNCEVKAIQVKDSQAYIMNDKCILCGHCLEVCPQNAKTLISDLERVKGYVRDQIPTIVSLAPAYLGVLKIKTPGQVVTGLKRLGFTAVHETAEGAAYVTREYNRILTEGTMENIITTCCQSVNDLVEIYYPSLIKYMAPVVSPMIAHGKLLRQQYGSHAKLVFLGPCISKKREAEEDERTNGIIDAVINFSEFEDWLAEEGISLSDLEEGSFGNPDPEVNRLYPISSGIISSVISTPTQTDHYRKFYVHGIHNCIELLESMARGEVRNSFIEANICNGGCIKGPAVRCEGVSRFKVKLDMEERIAKKSVAPDFFDPKSSSLSLQKPFCDHSPKDPLPSELEIQTILSRIGKTKPEHMLNCSACGYASCRDKAIATFQGKAELTMCIPFMHEKAQSMANVVLDNTPNMIIIADSDLHILEFSSAAEQHFHTARSQAVNMYLYELIDASDFEYVLSTHNNLLGKRVVYEKEKLATMQTIVYMEEQNCVLGIIIDITKEEEKNQKAYQVKVDTIEMAQRVIDKQMLVAQQIAGLLGETTAETKVTLTKLRDTILNDSIMEETR